MRGCAIRHREGVALHKGSWYGMVPKIHFARALRIRQRRRREYGMYVGTGPNEESLCQQHLGASRIDQTVPILHQFDDGEQKTSSDAEKERSVPGMR